MCLLVVLARPDHELPLVVAANRDEFLDRPTTPMAVLRAASPRIMGGRDELAGGTWLAINEAGVVAGLTNQPGPAGKDPTKRSRGELPLALAAHVSAAAAVEALAATCQPCDYNAAWLLVGDREALFAVDLTGGDSPTIEPLPPGLHILENRPFGAPSPKVDHVRSLLADVEDLSGDVLVKRLGAALQDHHVPAAALAGERIAPGELPAAISAACVHGDRYGTRWSGLVTVPRHREGPSRFQYTDGPSCRNSFMDAFPDR
jgi:uncharacterized protein with NRDE domain